MARPGDVIENPRVGARAVFIRTGRDTEGQVLELDLFVKPGCKPPPKHSHPSQEERFKVLTGSLTTWVAGKECTWGAGQECVVPKGDLHTWWNQGETEAHVRAELRPALHGDLILEAIYGMVQDGVRNPLQFAVFAWAFRDEGGFPGGAPVRILIATLAGLGRALGFKPDYPYPYERTKAGR